MPKNSALLEEVEAALKIYYDANDWLSNDEYKRRLKEKIGDGQDESAYTKKMQITSYFGFTKWQDINDKHSLRRITESGRVFYEHIRDKNKDGILEDLMLSLENTTFGRGNYGCPDSDSDIEAPNVFVRSIVELGYLTYREFAYLLWKIEDVGDTYTDALREVKQRRNQGITEIDQEAQKYSDAKPIMVLVRWGFLAEDDDDNTGGKHIVLSSTVDNLYKNRIKNLKIYNIDKNVELITDEPLQEIDTSGLTKYVVVKEKDSYSKDELKIIFKKELEKYPTNKWIGVMYLGIKYGHIVSGQEAKEILDSIGMAPTAITEYTKGKSLAETVVAKDELVPAGSVTKTIEDEDDIKDIILEKFASRTDFVWDDEKAKYEKFKSLFGKEIIKILEGKDLLYRLFAPKDKNPDSLKYAIEFSKEFHGFGRARVGENHHYFLYLPPNSDKWVKGQNYKTEEIITEEEAIIYAGELRDKLVSLFDRIEELAPFDSVDKYKILESEFYNDSFYTKQWVFKYMHMLYPEYFTNFYSWGWLERALELLKIEPQGSAWVRNGQISLLANELQIPNVFVYRILLELLQTKDSVVEEIEEEDEEKEEEVMTELPERTSRTYKQYPLNLILYGAPGTGKTYSTMELACSIIDKSSVSIDDICEGNTHPNREEVMEHYNALVKQGFITFTTFHQSYGYEDFIQGLRPDDKSDTLKFVPVDGVFKKIVNRAIKDQTNNYVIIIDEINRANISKVLGELITLLETDKRWGEINQLSTKLPSGQPFAVPNNLYVIGTMNSADKSISLIDAALRRRFEFIEVSVNYKTIANGTARSVLKKINEKLEGQLDSSDLLVGHAYFIGKDENNICDVLNHNVIPLLYEYFFDSKVKVKDVLKYALEGLNYEIEDEAGKRLRVKKA